MTANLAGYTGRDAGAYRLGDCLSASPDSAAYETEFGAPPRPAVIELHEGERALVERWRAAMPLRHPNLIEIYDAGEQELDDKRVAYVVMERADESLAGVLAERPLSETETREMLQPATEALRYLHSKGFVHAGLNPSNVMAAGDTLKLATHTVQAQSETATPADDVWMLGALIVEALTGRPPVIVEDEPYILRNAPDAFTEIARHTLASDPAQRWSLAEVMEHLKPGSSRTPIPQPEAVKQTVAPPAITREPVPEPVRQRVPEPIRERAQEPLRQAARAPLSYVDDPPPNKNKWLIPVIAAVAVALILMYALGRKKEQTAVAANPAAATTDVPASVPAPTRAEPVVHEQSVPSRVANEPAPGRRAGGWTVVVASYADRKSAERRVQKMERRWRKFRPEILEEPGSRPLHLVVIGHNLSEDEAANIRRKAVASGMPRDTYITSRVGPDTNR